MTAKNLLQRMNELISAHEQLLEAAEHKRRVIIQHDREELTKCYHEELRILEQISKIQKVWQQTASDYMREKGLPSDSVTVDHIAELLAKDEGRDDFQQAAERLIALIQAIKQTNQHNRQLIDRSLQHIDVLVELYQGSGGQEVTYSNPASAKYSSAGSMGNRFESKA